MIAPADEAREVSELLGMFAYGHHASKRAPRGKSPDSRAIGPGWDFTPHRNRPRSLVGLKPVTSEPWTRSELLNMEPHLEMESAHRNLLNSGIVSQKTLMAAEAAFKEQSEAMGNRLIRQQKRKEAAARRAKAEAIRAAEREAELAREAELEAQRALIDDALVREARAEDEALGRELKRLAEEAAAVAAAAAEAEAARKAEEERVKEEAEAQLREEQEAERRTKEKAKERDVLKKQASASKKKAQQGIQAAKQSPANTPAKGKKVKPRGGFK